MRCSRSLAACWRAAANRVESSAKNAFLARLIELVHGAGLAQFLGELGGGLGGGDRLPERRGHRLCGDRPVVRAPRLKADPQGFQRGAIALQHAKRAFQPYRVKQCRSQQSNQNDIEKPRHGEHSTHGLLNKR